MNSPPPETVQELRQRAEARYMSLLPEASKTPSPGETEQLLYELRVHQIELEMQNEELRRNLAERTNLELPFEQQMVFATALEERTKELNAANKALAEQADFSLRIFNSTDSQMGIVDPDGIIVMVNESWRRFARENLGEKGETWGAGSNYFVEYDDRWGNTQHAQEAFEGIRNVQSGILSSFSQEYPCHVPDGERRWFLLKVLPLQGKKGTVLISHTDISERKQMEEVVRAAHVQLEQITAAVPGVVYQFMYTATGEWKFIYVSKGLKDLYEIEPEEALRDCSIVTNCIVPEDKVSHRESVENTSRNLTLWVHEHRILTPGGTLKWVKGQAMPQQKEDGSVFWNGILIDITNRKRMEFEKVALAAVVENSDNIIVCKDMDLRVIATNMAFVQASGHASVSEMIGKTDAEIFGVSIDTEPIRTYMEDDRRAQQMHRGEIIIREETVPLPTGETKTVLTRKYPIYTSDGTLIGSGNISTDITELKRAEEEKLALQQQLQQSQRLESLGVLAGGIAHDFNNILAIIVGNCFLAKMHPDEAEHNISIIEKASERAADLCRQMLAYAGKGPCNMTLVKMGALVGEMVTMLKATINLNAAITIECSTTLPAVSGDASQFRQIVMNLIVNAAEAIGEAQGDVRISLFATMLKAGHPEKDHLGKSIKAGYYLCLQVTDSGCGMDDETMRKIFEPFFSTKFAGRGLGMSAMLGIITAHQGAVQLASQPGQGTTVKVYLPAQEDEAEKVALIQPIVPVPWQGSGTILLAEDEEQLLQLVTFMLRHLGFTVIPAKNGKEALELYRQHAAEITLVMTDIGMPFMDGYELFHELKKEQLKLPIIISSGFGDAAITARLPREEIVGFVSKPYRFDQLRDVVRGVVEKG